MWFKNALFYQFTKPFELNQNELEEQLGNFTFKPCGNTEIQSYGWAPSLAPNAQNLVHQAGDFLLINLKKQEKVLPASVVKELLEEKCKTIEQAEGRKVKGKEKQNIKEELIHSLLPQAFVKSSFTQAFIAKKSGFIIVDSASSSKAEEILAYLRKTLGTLPVVPLDIESPVMAELNEWVRGKTPANIELGAEVEFKDFAEDEGTIKAKNIALDSDDIQNHLDTGKFVTKLAIDWDETLSCIIQDDLAIKRIKFSDELKGQNDDITEDDHLAKLDADFILMSAELTRFIEYLAELFASQDQEN
ncbi:recombination-associated protein RdgC [Saccharobesus litoralis]|uniref:Recombination-associated protein RdgC n=1 Tax=Saccharobesus litoralis TaxID=2172099 RepID=A0A2S0VTV9_9ALTE|nr:recombination-associated protein RdgC [Saccharobesus litoralis]AWB67647.1 recombination-associated protein RdgC [Saccharobesus litoralis]